MRGKRTTTVCSLAAMCLSACLLTHTARATEVNGMIISRTGETLIVRSGAGRTTVILTAATKTKDDRGLLGIREEEMANIVLIPGLKVKIDGSSDAQGRVTANTITVDGDDLETAEMIQSGLHPTAEQVAANLRAIEASRREIEANRKEIEGLKAQIEKVQLDRSQPEKRENTTADRQMASVTIQEIQEASQHALGEYEVKAEATVKFDVGSTTISSEDEEQLKALAEKAQGVTGYIFEIKGFADSSGDALMNEKLSEDRAKRVVAYLIQQCSVPVRHIVAPGAMGEYGPAASNETPEGRAENRRVEIKVLVNKAIAGQ
jgi:outer membrane protein OmpA-like peptidoglycan-associated protein